MKTATEFLKHLVKTPNIKEKEMTMLFTALPKEERAKIRDVIEIDKGEKG